MTLKERNQAVIKKALLENDDVKPMRESFKRKFGFDPLTEIDKFPVSKGDFSWRKLENKLQEADASSSFTQFLRAGLQQIVNSMYETVETTYDQWVTVVQSNKDTDLYAPNQGPGFPRLVAAGELFPETGVMALDIQLKNNKYGIMYAIQRELLDDDQSGSFSRQAALLGEYMKVLHEVWCYGKLASASAMKYLDLSIPTTETKPSYESNYPYAAASAPFRGGGYNRPASFGVLAQPTLSAAIIGLMQQKNLQGIKMQVSPDKIICGPSMSLDVRVLLNSEFYPSGAQSAGVTGGAFAINVLKGTADPVISRFVFKNDGTVAGDSKAWYLIDSKKPFFILQLRTPIALQQEADNSGESFNRDIIRWRCSTRFNADFIDPRYIWQGNDGSVTT